MLHTGLHSVTIISGDPLQYTLKCVSISFLVMTDIRCNELVNENSRTIPISIPPFSSGLDDESNSFIISKLLFWLLSVY